MGKIFEPETSPKKTYGWQTAHGETLSVIRDADENHSGAPMHTQGGCSHYNKEKDSPKAEVAAVAGGVSCPGSHQGRHLPRGTQPHPWVLL